MNNIINQFLLAGYKFMPEMHLDNLDLRIVLVGHLQKTKQEHKKSKQKETPGISTGTKLRSPLFSII